MTRPRVIEVSPSVNRVLLELCRDGAGNPVIARRLGCTPDSVKGHMKTAMQAAGADTRTALAVALLRRTVLVRVVDKRRRGDVAA